MTTETLEVQPVRRSAHRLVGLDALRGLAVLCMVTDHLAYFAGFQTLRDTVGRVAMPLFFLLAGHLVRRLGWRTLGIFACGLLLPLAAPWIDAPNVLVWYAVGAVVVTRLGRFGNGVVVVLALTVLANGYGFHLPRSYEPWGLLGLMALGRLVPTDRLLEVGERLPRWLWRVGRYPLTVYVGHVLLLTALVGL